ncbi:MAG: zinc ribbon domain-containing protein [Planctomycetota bacterium]
MDAVVDFDQAEATCPACGTVFATTANRCPDCGLRFA